MVYKKNTDRVANKLRTLIKARIKARIKSLGLIDTCPLYDSSGGQTVVSPSSTFLRTVNWSLIPNTGNWFLMF